MLTATSTKENGCKTNQKEKVFTLEKTNPSMKVTERLICNTDLENNFPVIILIMSESIGKEKNMDMESSSGRMELFIKGIFV